MKKYPVNSFERVIYIVIKKINAYADSEFIHVYVIHASESLKFSFEPVVNLLHGYFPSLMSCDFQ